MYLVLQGCVQGYGNYDELTSGLDPTELFDDVEDKLSNLVTTEEYEDATEEVHLDLPSSPIDAQRLLVDRALNHGRQLYSESQPVIDKVSLQTVPSMYSLVSMPSHLNIGTNYNEVSR